LMIRVFHWQLPDAFSHWLAFLLGVYSQLKLNHPYIRAISLEAGTSMLDEALTHSSQRIALILIESANKDTNYIASLHNEVVTISQC
jgi:hypothetical protein